MQRNNAREQVSGVIGIQAGKRAIITFAADANGTDEAIRVIGNPYMLPIVPELHVGVRPNDISAVGVARLRSCARVRVVHGNRIWLAVSAISLARNDGASAGRASFLGTAWLFSAAYS